MSEANFYGILLIIVTNIDSKFRISVAVPVFNEEGAVSSTLNSLNDILQKINIDYEIIAVNDGSSDKSGEILKGLSIPNLNIIHHAVNKGYGASLKSAIKEARYPWILITDADGTYPVSSIPELLEHVGKYDMVVGSRNGKKVHDTFFRKVGRGIVRKFASYVSGAKIQDINSGLRIFKKEDAEKFWHLFPDGFSFTSTITVASHVNGNRVKYLPIDYHKRAGKSSIKPAKDFVGFLSLIAKLAIYFRPLKVFIPAGIFLMALAVVIVMGGYLWRGEILDATFAVIFITGVQVIIFGFIADMIVKRFYNN
ncbi:MAG: hypothetical protein COV30_01335 [Candidatus Yanofskybacteria bacterium CG10_big_fil_rev_8_21_14_0_10_37_15]|uniref:Glycosyltransferase 2-like domain-containing protein n=1 Tax=Candidatus Yanofskybacteria bacterium CG10_big_fil_rev_8_21_14_0_10_37_15 TaxID=1975097 RepID=A0A2H0R5N1_9BACT|nr:MAG: hypothetical protein COV30_01335 [Candidatus Yanofskybacteria bacterium CG10_big_fil_rev_8_21_14_0_10_37_15]